jgi:hypothetical protein
MDTNALIAATFFETMTFDNGYLEGDDFPRTEQPVWILGKQYSALYGNVYMCC